MLASRVTSSNMPSSASSDGSEDLAFAIVKPPGSDNSLSLNPFKPIKRGPDVYSLVTVRTEPSESGIFKGVSDAGMVEKSIQACIGQGGLRFNGFLSFTDYKHATGQHGKRNTAKLIPGAPVVVNLELGFDFFYQVFYVMGNNISSTAANVGQGYGKIVEVFTGPDGEIQSANVAFEGVWSDMWSEAVQLHYLTDEGFYANVPAQRLLAHASFRNVLMTTSLDYLQWEMALLWPEMVSLDEVVFKDVKTGAVIPPRRPNRIRGFLEGEVAVEIRGQRVPVLDPTLAVKPQALNLAISGVFAVGGICFLSGIWFPAAAWLACPAGVASMVLAALLEKGWQRIALEERSKFREELEGSVRKPQELSGGVR